MRITRLTPEQARAAGRALAQAARWLRSFLDSMRAWFERVAEALREGVQLAARLRPVLVRPDRPAWQSPYGPPRRH
jgi:hypothetical protein